MDEIESGRIIPPESVKEVRLRYNPLIWSSAAIDLV